MHDMLQDETTEESPVHSDFAEDQVSAVRLEVGFQAEDAWQAKLIKHHKLLEEVFSKKTLLDAVEMDELR
jgi:hypothetical protein